jgi:hypothetical protein
MNQISPRIFEAIGCGTLLILFEGEYSGILRPNLHYVPLKKDFSNLKSVISILRNEQKCKAITEQAYRDIIESGKYSYQTFIRNFDDTLKTLMEPGFLKKRVCAEKKTVSENLLKWSDPYVTEYNINDTAQFANWRARAKLAYKRLFPYGSTAYNFGQAIWHQLRAWRRAYRVWRGNLFRNRWFWREKPKIIFNVLVYLLWRKHVQHRRNC